MIVKKVKLPQIGQLPNRFWNGGNLRVMEVKPSQIGQLPETLWNGAHIPQVLILIGDFLVRNGCNFLSTSIPLICRNMSFY